MKKISILLAFVFVATFSWSQLIDHPAPSLKLQIQQSSGTNGSSVAYNPNKQMYYAVIAGNTEYPLETFDEFGNALYKGIASNDLRGIWWNNKEKALEGNCYADGGIIKIGLNGRGHASEGNSTIFSGANHQPNDHACGTYYNKKKEILYYMNGMVRGYKRSTGEPGKTKVYLALPTDQININQYELIFTGQKKMELGVLDYVNKKIYLFSLKGGTHTGTVVLPSNAPAGDSFWFSYANNYAFLYDVDARAWVGYRIFN